MSLLELLLIAVGLSMDAFAVSVCKGLSLRGLKPKHAVLVGLYFGGFQALMPVIGWLLGYRFERFITSFDHWIAFALLTAIGVSMIREAKKAEELNDDLGFRTMLLLAVATSIDALAVGVTFAFLSVRIVPAACLIGLTTFLLSALGVYIGHIFGLKYKAKAELAGGIILIGIGLKILLEHLGLISF
ncbi:MAG: manganese efflux pump MntP family protein [Oscillospiraceae bacterium]|nr:manganese efflux pump MntP family protein [Oscillospiraceae bacterium]